MNGNISALQVLVEAEKNKIGITKVEPLTQNNQAIGYTIYFSEGDPITIYHGKDGENGQDGKPGSSGDIPQIGVKLDKDGNYYWTIDGSWLTDDGGNKIRANGLDGEPGKDGQQGANGKPGQDGQNGTDGANGTNGKDGVTPQLKIENGRWLVSVDQGSTWSDVGPATAESGDLIFQEVDFSDTNFVKFTLTDGTELELVTKYAYETLKSVVDQLNTEIGTLRQLITALQNRDYITNVIAVYENDQEIGYKISFASGMSITICHGEKGEPGTQGEPGQPGQNGSTPIIGVKQDTDNIYYWTLNGEWLLDSNGQKVRVQGLDGQNGTDGQPGAPGSDGQNGKDGVTPQLKIENNYWYVSTDNGQTWNQLGKATGENGQDGKDGADGESLFSSIDVSENYVTLTLRDGEETIMLPTKHAFEQLQQQVNTLNTNISALQTIVTALETKTYITNIVEISDASNQIIGYKVVLSDNTSFTIYHGKDGANGETPYVGVIDIDGIYYWAVDGHPIKDNSGNSIKVTGEDGEDGITPQLKIEDGRWLLSYDYGATWKDIGQATGDQGPAGPSGSSDSLFKEVTIDKQTGTFIVTLADDTWFGLPMYVHFNLIFDGNEHTQTVYCKAPGKSFDVPFLLENFVSHGTTTADVQISVIGGSKNTVDYDSRGSGTIHLTASYEEKEEQIMVFVKTKAYTTWETFTVITDYDYAEVGDIFYQNRQPIGFVCKEKTSGANGKIMSCLQGSGLYWFGSPQPTDWLWNTYGTESGWYLPDIDELYDSMNAIVTSVGWDTMNEKLSALGCELIANKLVSATYNTDSYYGAYYYKYVEYNASSGVVQQKQGDFDGTLHTVRAIKEF